MNDLLYTQRLHGRLRWFHFNSGERKLPSENLTAAEQFCKVKKGALRPWKKQLQAKDYDSHFALISITYLLRDRAACRWEKSGALWSPFPQ